MPIFTVTLQGELKQAKATEQAFRSQVDALLKEKNAQTTINNNLILEVENYKQGLERQALEIVHLQGQLVELRRHIQSMQPFTQYVSRPPAGGP